MRSAPIGARPAVAAFTIALILGATAPPAALGHAELVNSTPSDGAELAAPPTEIRLVFSEAPRLDTLSVRLFDRRGTEIALGKPAAGPLPTTVLVPIPTELRPGPYTVVWLVVSAEDEHPETNEFVFGIGQPPGSPSVTAGEVSDIATNPLLPVSTLLAILGLTVMLGAAVQARFFGLDRPRVARLGLGGAGLTALALVVKALGAPRATATISDGSAGPISQIDPGDLARVTLLVVFAALVLASAHTSAGTSRRRLWLGAMIACVGVAWVQAASSHAAGVGILPWVSLAWQGIEVAISDPGLYQWFGTGFELGRQLNVLVAATHAVAVGAWVGGLLVMSLAGLSADELAAWHPRFSRFALRAFLVVAATGAYQAFLFLPSPTALVESGYGRLLLAKHVFVAGVLAMAALNRFVAGPALKRAGDHARAIVRARRAIGAEALIGIGVLAVTGLLATTAPARPATAIFLRPDAVAGFDERVVRIAGDQPNLELMVRQVSGTQHRIQLTGAADLAPDPTMTIHQPDTNTTRELSLTAAGGAWATEGLAFPRDGVWVASVLMADGREANFPLEVGFGRVRPYDASARALWDDAIARTEADMRSARMVDQLTDGLSVMLFGYHEFEAPDRERFDIQGRFSSVTADGRRYTREAGAADWKVQDAGKVEWPAFHFLLAAIGVTVEGEASQVGEPCQVLVGIDPQSDLTYEIWVGRDDGMIHRLVMGLPGHYMVNAYYDVNEPIDIEPPTSVIPVPS